MKHALITGLILILGVLIVKPGGLVFWVEDALASDTGKSLRPELVYPENAEHCVEPTEIMRRNHMDFLLHQRDETVLKGVRTKKHSLVECLDCHNPRAENKPLVRYENAEHFCAGCHQYASVKIDCFECHSDQGTARSKNNLSQLLFPDEHYRKLSSVAFATGRLTALVSYSGPSDVK